jgi:hypothetical protein
MKKIAFCIWSCLLVVSVNAQEGEDVWEKTREHITVKPVIGLQLWSSYTMGAEVFNEETQQYDKVDDRLNFQIRRSRFGFKGSAYKHITYKLVAAMDLVGRDVLSGTEGGSNNGASPRLRVWDAYVQWKIIPDHEKINIVAGYFNPQIGRASISSALRSPSMEKSWSQNYLRRHLVGIGPGRAVGLNIGGLFQREHHHWHWGYDVGIFNPTFVGYNGNSVGNQYDPLIVGRLVLYVGDMESSKYTIGHKSNHFGKRKGLSIALAGARQGSTDLFAQNTALGIDFLLNMGSWNIDGEFTQLGRKAEEWLEDDSDTHIVQAHTGYLRGSYNIMLKNNFVLEPTAMFVFFYGETDAEKQETARLINSFSGEEQVVELGANFYFNPDLKLSLHYTLRNAEIGEAGAGAGVNNFFFQNGAGAIRRGNWLGAGLVAIF